MFSKSCAVLGLALSAALAGILIPRGASAGDPMMIFDGMLWGNGLWIDASGWGMAMFTPNGQLGFQHMGKNGTSYDQYPRVYSFIDTATGFGPGCFVLMNGGGSPGNKIILRGDGQTQFNGGSVTVGACREPASGKFNVYGSAGDVWFPSDGTAIRFHTNDTPYWSWAISDGPLAFNANGQASAAMVIKSDGKIGIGVNSPTDRLTVDGAIRLQNTSDPGYLANTAVLFASGGDLWARSEDQESAHQLTSHADPRQVAPLAQCSFGDPSVALPFSFHHKNAVLGKGQVVDLAKMAAYTEQKMQAELGAEAGRLVYTYDLPAEETDTVAQCEAETIAHQAEEALATAAAMQWIPVELGAGGEIPAEAFEEVPETHDVNQLITVQEKVVDFQSGRVVTVERQTLQSVPTPTGQMTKRFKSNWKFENGVVYRRPTSQDVNLADFVRPVQLPQWVVDRAGPGAAQPRGAAELLALLAGKVAELENAATAASAPAGAGQGQ